MAMVPKKHDLSKALEMELPLSLMQWLDSSDADYQSMVDSSSVVQDEGASQAIDSENDSMPFEAHEYSMANNLIHKFNLNSPEEDSQRSVKLKIPTAFLPHSESCLEEKSKFC